ncbi:2-methylpropanoate--CoA ligase CCL4-like [Mercurialis annua]|uniref:2-methylpropanoate--CoA ligase CCL4-like n=1 Tax=Mercurialis annua TaxID=3986 RepID=UPI00215F80CA|nr:2-methylpropanoate--CoA ligase CCL4-like [Mercurialis annua]
MNELKPTQPNSSPLTPLTFLERAAIIYDDCPSIIYNKTTYTWSQTYRRCLQLASSLTSLGIKTRHVVSVLAPNIPAMYELHFAVPMSGAILNTINIRLDARTVSILLQHGESKLVFVDIMSKSLALEAISLLPPEAKSPILVLIEDDDYDQEVNDSFKVNASSTCGDRRFVDSYEGLVMKGDPSFKWIRPTSEWDPIVLNYTSGTTSSPKGVVHCHRGSFITALNCLVDWFVPSQPVFLWTLPMFHSNGWNYPWGMAVVGGVNICLRKFDGSIIYSLIKKHNVTHMCAAPVVLNMLSNTVSTTLEKPVHILTAGAPPPAAVLSRTESLGFIITHGYGMTETGGSVTSCAWKQKWNHFPVTERARLKARQGVRTVAMTEVDVIDSETGKSVKRDGLSLGEIVLRGGCIMLGYLKNPEATAKQMKENGWFYTGDVGVMHADGYLEIKDRSKDVIISGGENISSVEVESVLYSYPDIEEAAVVARPDEFWGESPCAFVTLKKSKNKGLCDQKTVEKEIIEYCKAKMPHYMVPKTVVVFKEELPKTSTGKIKKFLLRDMARAMGESRSSRL